MCISVSAHLMQLQNLSLKTLELLLILLRLSEDLITRSARLLQLPLVVLHLGLDENREVVICTSHILSYLCTVYGLEYYVSIMQSNDVDICVTTKRLMHLELVRINRLC